MCDSDQRAKSVARREFEAWAPRYDRSLLNFFMFGPSHRGFLEEIVRWRGTGGQQFDHLDIGCATGSLAVMMGRSPIPARTIGLDMAGRMVREALGKARSAGVAGVAAFVRGDSEHLPFADRSFDAITCSNSFHHYPHQAHAVAEMHRVLRPGGRLMIIDGFRDNVVGWFVFDVCIAAAEQGAVHHCTWKEFASHFAQAGFHDVTHRKINWWFPLLLTVGIK